MNARIYRLHYRGQLKEDISEEALKEATEQCVANVRQAQKTGKVLTAALYRSERMLFFYYEAVGEPLSVTEPILMAQTENCKVQSMQHSTEVECKVQSMQQSTEKYWKREEVVRKFDGQVQIPESGEDVQTTCLYPDELLAALNPYLQVWPGQRDDRLWVHMYHIYYHQIPESVEQWSRAARPMKRRGRIAFLRDDKLFSYTYFHKAIVDEGLLTGDKYQ